MGTPNTLEFCRKHQPGLHPAYDLANLATGTLQSDTTGTLLMDVMDHVADRRNQQYIEQSPSDRRVLSAEKE